MRPIRILHTADWHLGHTLLGHGRDHEHASFLAWLLDRIVEQEIDLLIVAGDVFDGRSPSGAAQAAYFGFLASLRSRAPGTEVVIVAGNHDSPSRLSSAGPVLGMLGVQVFGAASPEGSPRALALSVRTRSGGSVGVAAVPFVRPSDLRGVGDGLDPQRVEAALAALYRDVVDEARSLAGPGRPVIATGHAHLRGAVLSPRSERLLFGGEAGAIDRAIYPSELTYVALGHLHLAQDVGMRDLGDPDGTASKSGGPRVRYAGSPIPLALVEAEYAHSVSLVELEGDALARVTPVEVPRFDAMQRITAQDLDDALACIAQLPAASDLDPRAFPWLEVRVRLEGGARVGAARARIQDALTSRAARMVRLAVEESEAGPSTLAAAEGVGRLSDLDVRDVVRRRWAETGRAPLTAAHERALGTALLRAMQTVDEARQRREADRESGGELA